jgi:hypothetical protein
MLDNLCPPALLYLGFSLTQIIIDIFKNMYNTAIVKFIVMIVFTIVLNIMCASGLSVVAWMLVFIPFILMTIITSMLLFVFGLSPSKGNFDYNVEYPSDNKDVVINDKKRKQTHHNEYDPTIYNSGTPDDINNYN